MQLSHADIMRMKPEDAARELVDVCSKLPLLTARAGLAGEAPAELLSVGDVARRLGISASAVRMKAAANPLWKEIARKVGNLWRFDAAELERILSEGKSRELL